MIFAPNRNQIELKNPLQLNLQDRSWPKVEQQSSGAAERFKTRQFLVAYQ